MTIDEAIRILEDLSGDGPYPGPNELYEAADLGKEALKAIKQDRVLKLPGRLSPLPGETEK